MQRNFYFDESLKSISTLIESLGYIEKETFYNDLSIMLSKLSFTVGRMNQEKFTEALTSISLAQTDLFKQEANDRKSKRKSIRQAKGKRKYGY